MSQGTFDGVFAAGGPVTLYGWLKPTPHAFFAADDPPGTLPPRATGEAGAIVTAFPAPGPAGGEGGIFNAIPPVIDLDDFSGDSGFALGTVLGLPSGWTMAVTALETGPTTTERIAEYDEGENIGTVGPITFASYYRVKIVITPPTAQSVIGNFFAGYARRELPTPNTFPDPRGGGGAVCYVDYALVLTETPWEGPTSGAPPTPPPPYNPFGAAPVALDPYALINTYDYYVSGVSHVDAYQRGHFALGYALGLAPDGHTLRLTVPAGDVAVTGQGEGDFAAHGPPTDTGPSGAEFTFGLWVLAQDSAPHTTSTPSGGALPLTHNAAGQQTGPHLLYIPAQPTPGAASATAAAFALDLTTTLLSIAGTAYTLSPLAQGWDALGGAYIITGLNTAANVLGSITEATPFTEGVAKAVSAAVSAYGYSANPLYGYIGPPCLDAALTYTVPSSPPPPTPPPAATSVLTKYLAVPVMDADPIAGRVHLCLGVCRYSRGYAADPSTGTLAPTGTVHDVTTLSLAFCTSSATDWVATEQYPGAGRMPWMRGRDMGVPLPAGYGAGGGDGWLVLPGALADVSQMGAVRVGLHSYDLLTYQAGATASARFDWRETTDLGGSWHAGPATPDSALPLPPTQGVGELFLSGAGRGDRPLPRDTPDYGAAQPGATTAAMLALGGRGDRLGASGWQQTQGEWKAAVAFPRYAVRGSDTHWPQTAPTAEGSAPDLAAGTVTLSSTDDGAHTAYDPAGASVGSYQASLPGPAPGYPFAGRWDDPHAIFTPTSSPELALAPAGGLSWARGAGVAARLALACPALLRLPLPAPGGGFKEYTDPETASTGRDWGRHTCVCVASTPDGGATWGPLSVVSAGGKPVVVDAETCRVAAVREPHGGLLLCVCADGKACLYYSDDLGDTWGVAGSSTDGGMTWATGPPPGSPNGMDHWG